MEYGVTTSPVSLPYRPFRLGQPLCCMQSMECGGRSGGGRRLKDRLAQLLRPAANSLLRSPCSSSSSTALTSTATTTTTTTISTSSTSTTAANYTTIADLLPHAEPFSAALDRLRRSPPERIRGGNKEAGRGSSSFRHGSCRRFGNNAVVDKAGARKVWSSPYGFTSSGEEEEDDDDTDEFYGDNDTETFLSSRSLMSSAGDLSAFYNTSTRKPLPPPAPPRRDDKRHCRRSQRRRRRCRRPAACGGAGAVREPAGFRPLVMTTPPLAAAEEQVRKGLAVVKRSRDPYGDFRESMVEMIVGRQVFGAAELERLLRSYLTLNAPRFHPVILQAFSDIWVVLHGG